MQNQKRRIAVNLKFVRVLKSGTLYSMQNGRTHGGPYSGHGYVLLRFGEGGGEEGRGTSF